MILATPIFRTIGSLNREFTSLSLSPSLAADVGLFCVCLSLCLALKTWLLPPVLWYFLPRNLPYMVLNLGFFLVLCIPSALILFPFHDDTVVQAKSRLYASRHLPPS